MDYILTAESLCKRYRRFQALDDFSIHVPKGAIYGFIGRNGAGKTTLIRLICGLQEPTSRQLIPCTERAIRQPGIAKITAEEWARWWKRLPFIWT